MRLPSIVLQLVIAVGRLAGGASGRHDPEPWSDPEMTARDGLVLWLDASRLEAASVADGRPGPTAGQPLAAFRDGSGARRDFVQPLRIHQPRFERLGGAPGAAILRFDGVDDALHSTTRGLELREFTVVLLAAPRANGGGFRGFVAANAHDRNDYESGFNVDLSWPASSRFDALNVEGRGFGGAADLLRDEAELGTWHVITVVATAASGTNGAAAPNGGGRVVLRLDGIEQESRPRDGATLQADQWCVGARNFSNDSSVPCATGFLDGDFAELLVWSRALATDELNAVERRAAAKRDALDRAAGRDARLVRVPLKPERPPPVAVLAPGFASRPLPVELNNLNNLRFRDDGTLVALGYDGNVWLLDDRDHDGIEEQVRPFFVNRGSLAGPIGMALAPKGRPEAGGVAGGHGVYVACKGKVVLLADRDGDDVAESEEIVATGWKPIPQAVDAVGVALAPDGRLFFGLGTADYTNGHLIDAGGTARYDLASERGTILELSADRSRRRIFCTGVRFPVALAFNRAGDLFATDQEGATWLPNGNPFDELLWIREGRHYGFPPRHSRHLPDVVDEPSLFDYAPQHQSTCGFCFDEPRPGGRRFGPSHFEGSAFVAGYSRGRIERTELVRTRAGWIARSSLFARIDQLPSDVALSPDGRLLVSSHSGAPDWGSGPTGRGRIDALRLADADEPQPLFAWCAGPREVRVAFDRPLDPARWIGAAARARIVFGDAVGAADRLESHRPSYAVVERQLAAPRHSLAVESVQLVDGGATLAIRTAPHARLLPHALELPLVDLAYEPRGVAAEWRPEASSAAANAAPAWSGWLPHLDLVAAAALTQASRDHAEAFERIRSRGTLTLRTTLDLGGLLRPSAQPGSLVDDALPAEVATIELRSARPFLAAIEGAATTANVERDGDHVVRATLSAPRGALVPCEVVLPTGGEPPRLDVAFSTAEDPRPRALELRRFALPWAAGLEAGGPADGGGPGGTTNAALGGASDRLPGANWSRGRALFFGDVAMCSRCHARRDGSATASAARIGPDLSLAWQRDLASLRRDVLDPNASQNPDHLTWAFNLADGRELVGVPRTEPDGTIVIGEAGGKETRLGNAPGDVIVSRSPLAISVMPAGLLNVLDARQIDDLLLYLLTPPLEPAPLARDGAPPPRRRSELATFADPPPAGAPAPPPLRIVLSSGPKDHGAGEHDYPDWSERWSRLLALADQVEVATSDGWPSAERLASADVVVIYSANSGWSAARAPELDTYLARGGGLVLLHWAVNGRDAAPELAARIGLSSTAATRYRHGELALDLAPAARDHPIMRGLPGARFSFVDESYWALVGDPSTITTLATADEEGAARPQLWTREVGRGRVFVSIPGHYRWTLDDPLYRQIVLRGVAWSARQDPARLEPLATIGARLSSE